jgi:methylaspartate mutase epsilon subunit
MIRNRKLSQEEFFEQRKDVLAQWPTGKGIADLNEAIEYHKKQPFFKNMTNKLRYAKEHHEIYANTGMGKATIEEQIDLLRYTEKEGRADVLGLSIDSLTRQNDYKGAQKGLEESIKTGRSLLNGLPAVNLGVAAIRRMNESVSCPVRPRYGAADARLCDEILLAGGCSSASSDAFMDFWQHHAKTSLEETINTHQYVARLMGYYAEHGVPMLGSAQGLYGAGLPPSLQTAMVTLSLLLQAEQGVKTMGFMCCAHGNLIQDVASSRVRTNLLLHYLGKFGHGETELFPSLSFSLMQYPEELGANFAVVFMNTLMARLTGAQISDIRTIAEAKAIPTKEDMAYTFRTAKVMQHFLQHQKIEVDENEVEQEARMEEKEVRCILDKVLEIGDGDPLIGASKAVKAGVLDNPFAANRAAAGKVLAVKDTEGAIRYFNIGNLPFTKEIADYHKEKIAARETKLGKKINYEIVLQDLLAVSKGLLVE